MNAKCPDCAGHGDNATGDDVCSTCGGYRDVEVVAASLASAASDLFEVVKAAIPVLEAMQRLLTEEAAKRGMVPDDTLISRMRAAISKAEGQP